ncbi:MAG: 3-oxoacyl-[acyl-carrier-protein] reductase [Bacteroidota bacterium]
MDRLKSKVAIVTGGAQGIGKATALRFAQEGAIVIIWDVNKEKGEGTASEIATATGATVEFSKVDTTKLDEVKVAVGYLQKKYGSVDVLINNAGITRDSTLMKMQPEQWQQVLDVNLTGVFNCTQAVASAMIEQKSGSIVNASSVVGLYGNFGQTNYVATKAGVIGMTKVWARELGRKGIRVNAVAPGFIATEMIESIPEKVIKMIEGKTPLGTFGKPEDIANTYVFLASDEAAFINGATISVDGGVSI